MRIIPPCSRVNERLLRFIYSFFSSQNVAMYFIWPYNKFHQAVYTWANWNLNNFVSVFVNSAYFFTRRRCLFANSHPNSVSTYKNSVFLVERELILRRAFAHYILVGGTVLLVTLFADGSRSFVASVATGKNSENAVVSCFRHCLASSKMLACWPTRVSTQSIGLTDCSKASPHVWFSLL